MENELNSNDLHRRLLNENARLKVQHVKRLQNIGSLIDDLATLIVSPQISQPPCPLSYTLNSQEINSL